jgi:hypothetical protein
LPLSRDLQSALLTLAPEFFQKASHAESRMVHSSGQES